MRRVCLAFAVSWLWCCELRSQPIESVEPGVPAPAVILARPSVFPESRFVPAEVILQEADARQPLTEEGWIVTTRPASPVRLSPDSVQRVWEDVEHPRNVRQYATEIRLLQIKIAHLAQREAVYRYFNKTGALLVVYQNTRLARQAAEARLRDLRYERALWTRHHQRERFLAEHGVVVSQEIVPLAQ
ncbi:MAG: hypothetical protein AB7F89_10450 [Pirellulaceae bacterium]